MEKIKINKKAEGFKDLTNLTVNLAGITMEEIVDDLFLNTKYEYWSKDEVSRIYEVIKSFDGYSAEKLVTALFSNCNDKNINYDVTIMQLYFLIKIIRPDLFEDSEVKNV